MAFAWLFVQFVGCCLPFKCIVWLGNCLCIHTQISMQHGIYQQHCSNLSLLVTSTHRANNVICFIGGASQHSSFVRIDSEPNRFKKLLCVFCIKKKVPPFILDTIFFRYFALPLFVSAIFFSFTVSVFLFEFSQSSTRTAQKNILDSVSTKMHSQKKSVSKGQEFHFLHVN